MTDPSRRTEVPPKEADPSSVAEDPSAHSLVTESVLDEDDDDFDGDSVADWSARTEALRRRCADAGIGFEEFENEEFGDYLVISVRNGRDIRKIHIADVDRKSVV